MLSSPQWWRRTPASISTFGRGGQGVEVQLGQVKPNPTAGDSCGSTADVPSVPLAERVAHAGFRVRGRPGLCREILARKKRKTYFSPPSPPQIWDLETHGCCCTASSKASGIKGELTACLYLPGPRTLCVATDTLAFLHLKVGYGALCPLGFVCRMF